MRVQQGRGGQGLGGGGLSQPPVKFSKFLFFVMCS